MSQARNFADLLTSGTKLTANKLDDNAIHGNRNLIINGGMNVSQRGSSFSFAHDGTSSAYTLDRYKFSLRTHADEFDCTIAQVSDAPAGFSKSLKLTTGTAESAVGTDEYYVLQQPIEAQNLQHLQHGTSNAKSITVSFYVKSSITGTFGFSMYKPDNTPRVIAKTYTINSANTWERKSITIEGDTDQLINNDNGNGMSAYWMLGVGTDFNSGASTTTWADYGSGTTWFQASATNNVVTTAGATFQLTGVQLEVGEQATPFEHRSFGDELRRCQRYFFGPTNRYAHGAIGANTDYPRCTSASSFPVTMRATPTATFASSNPFTSGKIERYNGTDSPTATLALDKDGMNYFHIPSENTFNNAYNKISYQFGTLTADAEL